MKTYKIILAITVGILLTACKKGDGKPQAAPPVELEVYTASKEEVSERLRFVSRIYSNADIVIQPRVEGYLLKKLYQKGMPVKKGQLIYQIDPTQLNLTVMSNKAALAAAKVQLMEADNNYRRAIPLARLDAISQSSLDGYQAAYASAEAQLKSAEAQLNNSLIELEYASIYSPMDGIIGDTSASVGDLVGPGTQFSTLSTISDIGIVSVHLSIPLSRYLGIRGADSDTEQSYDNSSLLTDIELVLPDGSIYPYKGKYNYTEKNVGQQSGTIIIVINFPNPDGALKTGQYVSVMARVNASTDSVLVPQRAVSQVQNINSVWIVRPDSTLEYRTVTLGDTFGSMWSIDSGVSAGETVLVDGQMRARNGEKIVPKSYTHANR